MLELLRIKNLALIDDMELEFAPGLNVITGESGAGKSFILRAIGFILGEKIKTDLVRQGNTKAIVEALFRLGEKDYFLRRELLAETGRSRLYINDTLASQEKLSELRPRLVLYTQQHGQQRLLQPYAHKELLDSFLLDKNILVAYNKNILKIKSYFARQEALKLEIKNLEAQREFFEYQQKEIEKINPLPNEEDDLLILRDKMKKITIIESQLSKAVELLTSFDNSLPNKIIELHSTLLELAQYDKNLENDAKQLDEVRFFLKDLEAKLRLLHIKNEEEKTPEQIESRLWELQQLQRRMKRPLNQIVLLAQDIKDSLSRLDEVSLELIQLEKEKNNTLAEASGNVKILNEARENIAKIVEKKLLTELLHLGFASHIDVKFIFEKYEVVPLIIELIPRLYWVPNPGQKAQPLDKIASGGELSRFLLAISGVQVEDDGPALLFDEIDAGIGGVTLNAVAQRVRNLSDKQQIIVVSHWPQFAKCAHRHFKVEKNVYDGETYTKCSALNTEMAKFELLRMSGEEI